jgi:uncharacterized protein YdeI (YjbR/CyaY-like superfamily)
MRAADAHTEFFPNAQAFRQRLEAHAGAATELLVGYHKVATGQPSMSWSESVDEALCFGWIDGVRKRIDDATYQIRFTPRRPETRRRRFGKLLAACAASQPLR